MKAPQAGPRIGAFRTSTRGPRGPRRGRPTGSPWLAVLALALVFATTACGVLTRQEPEGGWDGGSEERTITLQVDNDNFYDARIFARWNGERQRLGIVTGNSSETFTFQGRMSSLRVEVDFVAAGGFVSDAINVGPGDRLNFRVPPRRF